MIFFAVFGFHPIVYLLPEPNPTKLELLCVDITEFYDNAATDAEREKLDKIREYCPP